MLKDHPSVCWGACTVKAKLPFVATFLEKAIESNTGRLTEPPMVKLNGPGDAHVVSEQLPKLTSTATPASMPGMSSEPVLWNWKPPSARIAICAGCTDTGPRFRSDSCAEKPVLPEALESV